MKRIDNLQAEQREKTGNREIGFGPGDTVKVHTRIVEGEKERIQIFEGTVIRIKRNGASTTFTVRKTSYGVGVEKIFPLHGPGVTKVERVMVGQSRRAKLYYLRQRRGKAAKIKEKRQA